MLKEYSYFSVIPDEMKIFFLRPFNYREYKSHAEYSLERLNILDLSVQWIHFSMNTNEFTNLLKSIFYFLSIQKSKNVAKEELRKHVEKAYIEKVDSRIKDLKSMDIFPSINQVIKNSTCYESLDSVINHYKKLFEQYINLKEQN